MIGDIHIKLGSGRAKKHHAGNKGALLDRAAFAGINVPEGVLILDTAWDQGVLRGVIEFVDGRVHISNPKRLVEFLDLPRFEGALAIRSAFSAEDTASQSLAGYFKTVLNVPANDPGQIADAFKAVLESASRQTGRFRRDVLVMRMIDAKHAGVAFTEREHEDDLVNYVEGTAQGLVSGQIEGESLSLPKLRHFESATRGRDDLARWQRRLQTLLKQVRRWLGDRDWDIEWADDGDRCYLLQLRPITAPTTRDEAFTIANHKEILPEVPSRLMTTLIDSCADELFAYYRAFDPALPANRPFIEVFYGRPYINLSLMTEMMRIFGLPTRLVTDNIGGQTERDYGLNLGRMLRKIIRWRLPRMAFAQINAVRNVQAKTVVMKDRITRPGNDFPAMVETMRWLYIALVTEMFSLTAAMGPMLSILRRFGTLDEHNARQVTVGTQMYHDLDPLREIVARHADLVPVLAEGDLPDDDAFRAAWDDYISQYGHRGVYESDIARPRYRDDPSTLLKSLTMPVPGRPQPPRRSFGGILTAPFWWQAGRAMRAREQWRHDVMAGFAVMRDALLDRAHEFVERGILPYADALWMLTTDELRSLDGGWEPERDFWMDRRREIADMKAMHLPDFFHRFDDLSAYLEHDETTTRLNGISLTKGTVSGVAWVLGEPEATPPPDFKPSETILIARSVDAGWISTFSRVAGVVVETGGDLSHGSIILREIGLPAVTNVHGAMRHVHTGDAVRLDARMGTLQIGEGE